MKVSVAVSEKYKILNQEKPYFVTFAVEGWVDVFTREEYRQVIIDSLKHCQKEKGLVLFAWCLMTNHIHLVIGRKGVAKMEDIVRDFKKFTSVKLCRLIETHVHESRREWMLRIFRSAAEDSSKHEKYKFWQSEYHPIELDGNAMIDQKLEYIHDNPVEAGIVDVPENYLYSSAPYCAGQLVNSTRLNQPIIKANPNSPLFAKQRGAGGESDLPHGLLSRQVPVKESTSADSCV